MTTQGGFHSSTHSFLKNAFKKALKYKANTPSYWLKMVYAHLHFIVKRYVSEIISMSEENLAHSIRRTCVSRGSSYNSPMKIGLLKNNHVLDHVEVERMYRSRSDALNCLSS